MQKLLQRLPRNPISTNRRPLRAWHLPKGQLKKLEDLDMAAYRNRLNNVLQAIIDQNETLRKIRIGQPVTENDLEALCSLVLIQEPGLDLHDLMDYFKHAESLDQAIREIIGMDGDEVRKRFTEFVQAHPNMASHQIKFLDLLQNHIAKFGSIKTDIFTNRRSPRCIVTAWMDFLTKYLQTKFSRSSVRFRER